MNNSINPNSQYYSIVPQNGTTFTAGNKVIFEINPNVAFVKGKDCYLCLDVFNSSTNKEMWAYPNVAGANSLIERMDIYSLNNGTLLESLSNYNQWSGLENQYLYDVKDGIVSREGVSKECHAYNVSQNQTTGVTTHSINERVASNLSDVLVSQVEGANALYMAKRFCIPLRSGIFNWWNLEEKLTPVVLYGGLRIEITLADNNKVCKCIYGKDDTQTYDLYNGGVSIANDAAVGGANTGNLTSQQNYSNVEDSGLVIGNKFTLTGNLDGGGGGQTKTGEITNLSIAANKLVIAFKLDGGVTLTNIAGGTAALTLTSFNPAYTLKKAELKLLQVLPTQQMMNMVAKESQIEFLSYDLFLDTLPNSSLSHQTEINSVANRGKAVFSMLSNVNQEDNRNDPSYYNGVMPNNTADNRSARLNSVQYFINNKLFPLHDYNPQRTHDKVQSHNELIKSWSSINKPCKNLGDSKGANMADYTNTFLISRELARENMVYPLKNSEAELRTKYDNTRAFNCRIYTYVFSEKIVNVSDGGLSVIL